MTNIGTVKGHEFRKNKEGAENVIMLSVEITEAEDVQSIQLYTQVGDESIPSNGDQVIILNITNSWRIAIATKDSIVPSMNTGEKKLYSVDSAGDIAAFINFLNTGILELNGSTEFAVLYTALNTQFQTFVTDINTALAGKLDGAGTAGALALDLSTAKSTTVKL